MDRVKIQEIAIEAGASNAVLIEKAKELGYDVKASNSTVTVDEAGILVDYVINGGKLKSAEKPKIKVVKKADVEVTKKVEEEISSTIEDVVQTEVKEEKLVVEDKKPVVKSGIKKSASKRGSITISPKRRKIEIVEVKKEEPVAPPVEEKVVEVVAEVTPDVKAEESVKKVEVVATDKSEAVEATDVKVEETKTGETAVEATDVPEVVESAMAQKRKARRKRAGITVVKSRQREAKNSNC